MKHKMLGRTVFTLEAQEISDFATLRAHSSVFSASILIIQAPNESFVAMLQDKVNIESIMYQTAEIAWYPPYDITLISFHR